MAADIISEIAALSSPLWWVGKLAAAAFAAAAAAAVCIPAVHRWMFPAMKESGLRDFITFDRVLADRRTIRCVNGRLLVTIAIGGIDLTSTFGEEQDRLYMIRKTWLNHLADFDVRILALSSRRLQAYDKSVEAYENPHLRGVQDAWQDQYSRSFRNSHLVVLMVEGGQEGARTKLREAVRETMEGLRDFSPRVLEIDEEGGRFGLKSAWGALLNPVRPAAMPAVSREMDAIDRRLADDFIRGSVSFGHGGDGEMDGIVEFREGNARIFMAAVGVATLGSVSSTEIFRSVLAQPFELIVAQWIRLYDRAEGGVMVQERQRRSLKARMVPRIQEEYNAALDLLSSKGGEGQALCKYQAAVFVYAESRKGLDEAVAKVRSAFGAYEFDSIRESYAVQPLWLSLFPFPPRWTDWMHDVRILSGNAAHFLSFETPAHGITSCDWGNRPVIRFKTATGTPYSFCFHRTSAPLETGHTLIVGGTGRGKTFIANLMATAALAYPDLRVFMFDRYDGSYVAAKAFGGSYITLSTDAKDIEGGCLLNPFHMDIKPRPDGGGPGHWLNMWLRDLVCRLGEDSDAEQNMSMVIRTMANMPIRDRSMTELYNSLQTNSAARAPLKKFVEGEYHALFNGSRDTFSVETAKRLVAIDFTRFFDDPVLVGTVLPYLSYRIETAMQVAGTPYLMLIDEMPALLGTAEFRDWFFRMLRESRKMRGVIVCCAQRPGDLEESGAAELVLGQCPTQIIFPDPNASEKEYMGILGLSRSDLEIVRGRHPLVQSLPRYVLLRRQEEGSIILDVDAGPALGKLVKLFASGAAPADRARFLEKNNPDDWVERYLESTLFSSGGDNTENI